MESGSAAMAKIWTGLVNCKRKAASGFLNIAFVITQTTVAIRILEVIPRTGIALLAKTTATKA